MKLLLHEGGEHIGGDGRPHLRLHRVLAGAQKLLDAQVLRDPREEQFDLPALLVQRADRPCGTRGVVGQKHQPFARVRILEANAPQMFRIISRGIEAIERNALIADHATVALAGRGVHPPRVEGRLRTCDEERAGLMPHVQPREVHLPAIHHGEGTRLEREHVQHLHVVQRAIADIDERRNTAAQVQQGVPLDGRVGRAKRRPGEQTQAQIDGAGIERVYGVVQLDTERVACVERAGAADQHGGQVEPDAPVARFVGIGQRGAFDRRAKPHRIELGGVGGQAALDVAQALAPGELREGHRTKLLGARQRANTRVASISMHDARAARPRYELHDLGEQRLANIPMNSSGWLTRGTYMVFGKRSSSRHQTTTAYKTHQCVIFASARVIEPDTNGS